MSEPIAIRQRRKRASTWHTSYVSVRVHGRVRRGSRRDRVTSAADWPRGPIVPESSGEGPYGYGGTGVMPSVAGSRCFVYVIKTKAVTYAKRKRLAARTTGCTAERKSKPCTSKGLPVHARHSTIRGGRD